MALHKDLTGAELHEPKGIESASAGTVYVADGSGSGAWTAKNSDILNVNKFYLSGTITDVGTASSSLFLYVPIKCELTSYHAIIHGALATADTVISVYINGVLFADTLTLAFAGSSAGQAFTRNVTTSNTINAGSRVEFRTDGGTSSTTRADLVAVFTAKA